MAEAIHDIMKRQPQKPISPGGRVPNRAPVASGDYNRSRDGTAAETAACDPRPMDPMMASMPGMSDHEHPWDPWGPKGEHTSERQPSFDPDKAPKSQKRGKR